MRCEFDQSLWHFDHREASANFLRLGEASGLRALQNQARDVDER